MKVIAYMAQSLDGYIAGPNGELDWLGEVDNPDNSDFGFADFMINIDALLMGKNTFDKVLSFDFWPYDKPVYVASNSLTAIPQEHQNHAFLLSGNLPNMLNELSNKGIKNLYIDGGKLIQSALQQQLLDELIVTSLPVILGQGIPLLGQLNTKVKLSLVGSEVLLGQMVKTHYKITGG